MENEDNGFLLPETVEMCKTHETPNDKREGFKTPRAEGEFSGKESLIPRQEECMQEEVVGLVQSKPNIPSYREILKPRVVNGRERVGEKNSDEAWDGNLYAKDESEMTIGVTITDTNSGPSIVFFEGEKRRLAESDIGNGYFTATFQELEDYFFVLDGGPWLIQNHHLTVQT